MAAVDYFLKIAGIDGESQNASHKGEIDVESWSWSETQPRAVGGGGGAGKVEMTDFTFAMKLSKASPKLFLACAQGEHIKSAWLTAHRPGAGKATDYFLKWSFADLLVSSYQTGASGDLPTDQVSFNFSKIEVEYKPQKPDGSLDTPIKAGWDVKTNKKI